MLALRILTAVMLIPPLLLALFYLPSFWIAWLFGVVIAAGAWEWTALMGLRSVISRILYIGSLVGIGALLLVANQHVSLVLLLVATMAWVIALIELVRQPRVHQGKLAVPGVRAVVGFFILIPAWFAAFTLHAFDPASPRVLLFALILVWVADSAAYFAGHFFGRTKLAPTISPGKTVEGAIGGVIGVAVVAWLAGALIWGYAGTQLFLWIALAVITALFSVVGDLFESAFKRIAGVKDSGRILPGHGGVLDRIDAVTAALPIFAFGWHGLFRST